MRKSLTALVLVLALAGCPSGKAPTLNQANIRSQLKDNFKSVIEGIAKEARAANKSSLMGAIKNIRGLVGIGVGDTLPDNFDVEFLTKALDKFFESELALTLFSDSNISSRSETEVTYVMDRSLCDKLSGLMPDKSKNNILVDTCKQFLQKNALELHVNTHLAHALELGLWHGRIKNGSTNKNFVFSITTSPNSIGNKVSLDGSKELANAIIDLSSKGSDSNVVDSSAFNKMSGSVSWQLRFKSDNAESGCKNNEGLCLIANVDEDVDVLQSNDGSSIKLEKSPKDNPTISIFAGGEGFKGHFNFGRLDGHLKRILEDGKVSDNHLFVEKSEFSVTVPDMKDASNLNFIIENFKAGPSPSFFEGFFGKKIVIDLAHDSRMIEKIKFAMDTSKAVIDLSPFAIAISLINEANESCKTYESFKIVSDPVESTQLVQFFSNAKPNATFSLPKLTFYTSESTPVSDTPVENPLPENTCSDDNLGAFKAWSKIKVSSDSCDKLGKIAVRNGSLEMNYKYHLNSDAEKSIDHKASKDQCLEIM